MSSLPFNNLITVARLTPRYGGDPCVLGTGNAAQCARFGAPAVGSTNAVGHLSDRQLLLRRQPRAEARNRLHQDAGLVLTPTFIPGLNVSVDWYNLDLRGAVGVIQPIAAITSCYVTNPVPAIRCAAW
jgi:hypothetical protein